MLEILKTFAKLVLAMTISFVIAAGIMVGISLVGWGMYEHLLWPVLVGPAVVIVSIAAGFTVLDVYQSWPPPWVRARWERARRR